ncbi:MAG: hypothetical protein EPN61_12035 [Burkholderiaceae bacterium]|nr:MAG: hypothetical protein EPN61_12035 [Burkholderiaceae bacterium]
MNLFNTARKYGAQITLAAGALLPMLSHAADPADAMAALGELSGTTTGFGPPLFGLAVVATGIMIGVAWIKKGRGAAR